MYEEVSTMGDYLSMTRPDNQTLYVLSWAFSNLRTQQHITEQIKNLEEIDPVIFDHDIKVLKWALKKKP